VLVIIAIIGMIITSILVIITGFAELFRIVEFFLHEGLLSEEAGKFLSVTVTEMIDLHLIEKFTDELLITHTILPLNILGGMY